MTLSLVEPGHMTILYGAAGSGKTAVAVGVGETLVRSGKKVVYIGMPKEVEYETEMIRWYGDRVDTVRDAWRTIEQIVAANPTDCLVEPITYVILDRPVVPSMSALDVFMNEMPIPVGVLLVVPSAESGGLIGPSRIHAEAEAIFFVQKADHDIIITTKKNRRIMEEIDVAGIEKGVNAWARAKSGEPDTHWTVIYRTTNG